MIPHRFLLSTVSGVFNAVYVSSQALGASMYYGRGAGMMPTAVAVVSDLIEVSRDILGAAKSGLPLRLHIRDWRDRPIRDGSRLESRYYLRFTVTDRPGVLAQIAGVLGDQDISINEVVQEGAREAGAPVAVVVTTHRALEKNVQAALAAFAKMPACVDKTRVIRILE
jgi:homoserine dehydrogenase